MVRHHNRLPSDGITMPGDVEEVSGISAGQCGLGVTRGKLNRWLDWKILKVSCNHDDSILV